MSDRKKMINELTYQINSNEVMRQHYPVQLSVTDARKILELLKEQEPRVMAVEEVKKHNNKDNCVWFELRDIVIIPVFVRQDRQETIIENPCILSDQTIPHLYWKNIDYCKKWRCWTSRPTDEQRKAVKWDDD